MEAAVIDHVLTGRDLLRQISMVDDLDAPVVVRFGLFGHAVTHVRGFGMVNDGDYRMRLARPLPELVVADSHYDKPDSDSGWKARGQQLDLLLDRIKEPRK